MDEPAAGVGGAPHFVAAQPHAMGEDRTLRQRVERQQPFERPGIAAPARVVDVGLILGDVDMDDRAEFARQRAGFLRRFVGDREAGVQPDQAAHQRRRGDATAFRQAAARLLAAEVALGGAVAEQRAHAEVLAGFGEDRQRPVDQVRRLVMVDERRRAGEQRAGDSSRGPRRRDFRASSAQSSRHHTRSRISRKLCGGGSAAGMP